MSGIWLWNSYSYTSFSEGSVLVFTAEIVLTGKLLVTTKVKSDVLYFVHEKKKKKDGLNLA